MKKTLLLLLLSFTCSVLSASTFTVLNTNASGADSFLEAIDNANLNAGADIIEFNIPGMPPHVIPLTILSTIQITEAVIIDGTTQPDNGYSGNCPKITLDAATADITLNIIIAIEAMDVSIYGMAFKNYTTQYSTFLQVNDQGAIIGAAGKKNIFNNVYNSITINAHNLTISSNYFGCNCDGDALDANTGSAIVGFGAMNNLNVIDNLISGNVDGIVLGTTSSPSDNLVIKGNKIGTDISGTSILGNIGYGMQLRGMVNLVFGGSTVGEGNLISGNEYVGCLLVACSGTVMGNFIGTDITGNDTLPNDPMNTQYSSALNCNGNSNITCSLTIGGMNPGERNVIFGNNIALNMSDSSGIYLITNNLIGQTLSGLVSPTQRYGIQLYYDTNNVMIQNNHIYGFDAGFHAIHCRGFTASENIVGVDVNSVPLTLASGFYFNDVSNFILSSNQIQNCYSKGFAFTDCNDGYAGFNEIHDCNYPISAGSASFTCHHNQFDKNIISNNLNSVNLNNGTASAANDDIMPPAIIGSNADSTWGTATPDAWVDLALDITLDPAYPQGYSYPFPTITADATGHWVYVGSLANPNEYTAMQTDLNNNSSGFSQRLTLGIDKAVENKFRLYPVPARDYLYLQTLGKNVMLEWEMYNSMGEVVKKGFSSGAANERIDIKNLGQGYYFVRIITGEGYSTLKCIKF